MKELFVEQQRAWFCGGVVDALLNALFMPWQRDLRLLARQLEAETLNQPRYRSSPTLILLAGQGAYAGSSMTVVGR